MDWSLIIHKTTEPPPKRKRMRGNWVARHSVPIGTRQEVKRKISAFLSVTSWENDRSDNLTQWAEHRRGGIVFQFMIPPHDVLESFEIRVRKAGLNVAVTCSPVKVIMALLGENEWYAYDEWAEQWLHRLTPEDRGWKGYLQHRSEIEAIWQDVR